MPEPEENNDFFDFNDLEQSFDFDVDAFNLEEDDGMETRIIKPPKSKDRVANYKNASKTALKIFVEPGMNYFGILDGSFIYGDLIEAILVEKRLRAYRMDIQTLSMSQDNVDSLELLLTKGYVKDLNLIISDYFYAHERSFLIPYIYEKLDIDNRFQLAVAGLHTKITTLHLTNGIKMVIHGSSNLRSSGNIEQVVIQDSPEIYDFVIEMDDKIIEKFKTINKSIRRKKVWQTIAAPAKKGQDAGNPLRLNDVRQK